MPLPKELEDVLALITDAQEREQQRKIFEKYEGVRGGYLRQADYDRQLNGMKGEREQEQQRLAAAEQKARDYQKWYDENKPKHDDLLTRFKELQSRNEELESKVSTAAAPGNGDGTGQINEAELLRRVNAEIAKSGYVNEAKVNEIVAAQAQKLRTEEREAFLTQTMPHFTDFNQALVDLRFEHQRDFGTRPDYKPLDYRELMKYMSEKKIPDPRKAYAEMTTAQRSETEREKIRAEEAEKLKSTMSVPGAGVEPSEQLGPVTQFIRKSGTPGAPPPNLDQMEPGTGALAAAAAAELRSEGKVRP